MTFDLKTPKDIVDAYKNGLPGAVCNIEDTEALLSSLPIPLFGNALAGSGKGKLALLYKYVQKFEPEFGSYERQVVSDCYAPGTIVSGPNKPIEQIDVGDEVTASDGTLTKVISTQKKISYNPLVTIKTKGSVPLVVTSDHKVLVTRMGKYGNAQISPKLVSRLIKKGSFNSSAALILENRTQEWVTANEIKKGDWLLTPINNDISDLPAHELFSLKDGAWFFGYFLGDGWCDDSNIEITFANHQSGYADRVMKVLNDLGFAPYYDDCGKEVEAFRIRCWAPELASWLRNISYDSNKVKVLPEWGVGNEGVLDGLICSDGFVSNDNYFFDNTSPSLAYGVYQTFIKMGHIPTINYFHRSKKGSYKTNKRAYRVSCNFAKKKDYLWKDESYIYIPVVSTQTQEGPHVVYDIGVAHKSHAFVANGVIAHNCVAHATRNAIDVTRAFEILELKEAESFLVRSATEGIYGSRGHSGEGMSCSGAAKFVTQLGGVLLRQKYGNVDLTSYDGKKAASWGRSGTPKTLIEAGKKNPVKTASLIRTTEGARDSLANGYAMSVCSNVGFNERRDKNGIADPKGSWNHAMAWIAVDDTRTRLNELLFLVQNSWGLWNGGPKFHEQPDGSFWIRESVAAKMLAQNGAWVYSNVVGFPPRKVTWTLGDIF